MTQVHLYNTEIIDYFADDLNPNFDIGRMLSSYDANKNLKGADLLLCGENRNPILIRYKGKLYDMGYFYIESENILNRVPNDSHWSQLKDEAEINVTPEEISERVKKLGRHASFAAEYVLEDRLKASKRKVGIFHGDKGKLVVFVLDAHLEKLFVEKKSFEYSGLANQLLSV